MPDYVIYYVIVLSRTKYTSLKVLKSQPKKFDFLRMLRNVIKRSQTHLSKRLTSILSGQRDRFGGVTVYSSDYPGVSDFKSALRSVP